MAATGRPGVFFSWRELQAAGDLELTPADRRAYTELCRRFLDPMRREFGVCTVHSTGRSTERNRRVGGALRSYHLLRLRPGHAAADVSFASGSPREWAMSARRHGAVWVGQYANHVHVDTRLR